VAYAERRGNLWRARWRGPDGTLESESGFTSKTAAEKYGRKQEAAIENNTYVDPRAGQITTPRTLGDSGFLGCCGSGVLFVSGCLFRDGVRAWFLPACRGGGGARFRGPRSRERGTVPPSRRAVFRLRARSSRVRTR